MCYSCLEKERYGGKRKGRYYLTNIKKEQLAFNRIYNLQIKTENEVKRKNSKYRIKGKRNGEKNTAFQLNALVYLIRIKNLNETKPTKPKLKYKTRDLLAVI